MKSITRVRIAVAGVSMCLLAGVGVGPAQAQTTAALDSTPRSGDHSVTFSNESSNWEVTFTPVDHRCMYSTGPTNQYLGPGSSVKFALTDSNSVFSLCTDQEKWVTWDVWAKHRGSAWGIHCTISWEHVTGGSSTWYTRTTRKPGALLGGTCLDDNIMEATLTGTSGDVWDQKLRDDDNAVAFTYHMVKGL